MELEVVVPDVPMSWVPNVNAAVQTLFHNVTAVGMEPWSSGGSVHNDTTYRSVVAYGPARYPIFYSPVYKSIATVFHCLIFLFGVLGNVLVAMVVLKKRFLQTPVNFYIVSLAAADILVLIASIPDTVASYYRPASVWVLGTLGCKFLIFCQYLGINASSASMLAFTLERYLAVCRPVLDSQASIGKVRRIIAGIWLFVSLYCSPWFWLTETVPISFDVDGYREAERCDFKFSHEPHAYATVFIADLLLFYIIPLGICSLLYAKMGLVLYKSIRGAGGSSRNRTLRVSETGDSIELYALTRTGSIGSDRARKIVRSRIQVVRMLGLVVLLFAVLSLPYRGLMVYNCFAGKPWLNLWYLLFAKSCIYLNSAINPLLYNFMSTRFRMAFRGMLCQESKGTVIMLKKRPPPPYS